MGVLISLVISIIILTLIVFISILSSSEIKESQYPTTELLDHTEYFDKTSNYSTTIELNKTPNTNSLELLTPNQTYLDLTEDTNITAYDTIQLLSPSNTSNITSIGMWIKYNEDDTGNGDWARQTIAMKGATNNNYEWAFYKLNQSSPGTYAFAFYNGSFTSSAWVYIDENTSSTDEWNHISIISDGISVYGFVNGEYNAVDSIVREVTLGNQNLTIGQRPGAGESEHFNGSIDDFYYIGSNITIGQLQGIMRQNGNYKTPVVNLMYHRVWGEQDSTFDLTTTKFDQQLEWLSNEGFESINTTQYASYLNGTGTIPDKSVLFVFDDGHRSLIENASDIMANYGFTGIVGVVINFTNHSGVGEAENTMNWTRINELVSDYGWDIASHSFDHCAHDSSSSAGYTICNTTINRTHQYNDSRWEIYEQTGIMPVMYVYPGNKYGDSDAESKTIYEECINYYDFCTGASSTIGSIQNSFVLKTSGFDYEDNENDFHRIGIQNKTTLEMFDYTLNWTSPDTFRIRLPMNENNGSVVHDTSGNGANGTLFDVSSWRSDTLWRNLTDTIDYTLSGATITLEEYLYWGNFTSYYQTGSSPITNTFTNTSDDVVSSLSGVDDWFSLFIVMGAIVVIILLVSIIIATTRGFGGGGFNQNSNNKPGNIGSA